MLLSYAQLRDYDFGAEFKHSVSRSGIDRKTKLGFGCLMTLLKRRIES